MYYQINDLGILIRDNVIVTLEDVVTGEKQTFSAHNSPTQYALNTIAAWLSGVNNVGYNAKPAPTQIQLGTGTGTPGLGDIGLYTPVSGTLKTISYANISAAQTIAMVQYLDTDPANTFTEAGWFDVNGNLWFHVVFQTPITKSSQQNLSLQWTNTMQVGA